MSNKTRICLNDWTLNTKGTTYINNKLGYKISLVKEKHFSDRYEVYDLILNKYLQGYNNLSKAFIYTQRRVRPI